MVINKQKGKYLFVLRLIFWSPGGQRLENVEENLRRREAERTKRDPDHQLLENLMVAKFSQHRSRDHREAATQSQKSFPDDLLRFMRDRYAH